MSIPAILHVGMPKCGSSAIQTALCASPDAPSDRRSRGYRYVAITPDAELLRGPELVRRAALSARGYVVTPRPQILAALGVRERHRLRDELVAAAGDGQRLVLSNEAWGNDAERFAVDAMLDALGLACEVVMYVRPQVEWCNAAWWQWGAWSGATLDAWLASQFERSRWHEACAAWSRVPGVASVTVRLLPRNIVADFFGWMGVAAPAEPRVNAALSGTVLRMFQRHRALRGGPHDAALDFVLGRLLRFDGAPAPWVLDAACVRRILDASEAGNRALLDRLDPAQAAIMRADPAWWSAAAFSNRLVEHWQPVAPGAAESDRLAAAAVAALYALDEKYRQLLANVRERNADADRA